MNYQQIIIELLLKKYYRQQLNKNSRKINIQITQIAKDYFQPNISLEKKECIDTAIEQLAEMNFLFPTLKNHWSHDYIKITLNMNKIPEIEEYAKQFGLKSRSYMINQLGQLIDSYKDKSQLVDFYIRKLKQGIDRKVIDYDINKEENILKLLLFLSMNKNDLYIREMSALVLGDTKSYENEYKILLTKILSEYFKSEDTEDQLLRKFNIYDTDQELIIKGNIDVHFENQTIKCEQLSGGISLSYKDINKITKFIVKSKKVITVENKTSFLRLNGENCYIYLGGFATSQQILLLKKLILDNDDKAYFHFGDIDAGGFLIHKSLCEQTGKDFKLLCMGVEELQNPKYKICLKALEVNDITRLKHLQSNPTYTQCVNYMLDNNVKLEQEIISLDKQFEL